jgi:flagellar hook assembly protein FlgD
MNFKLNANFPNPFNPSTMIVFYLPRNEHVTLKIYDTTGKEIETLIQGEVPAGEHRIHWTAGSLASGIYLCRMETKDFSETIKMVYQK